MNVFGRASLVQSGNRFFALLVICALLFISCKREEEKAGQPKDFAEVGGPAPDFILKDLSGNDVQLSQYRGKVVLLEFWTTWCPPCKAALPDLMELQRRYAGKDFTILAVSMDTGSDSAGKLVSYQREYNLNYPVLLGTQAAADSYKVRSIPTLFLIGRDGRISDSFTGYSDNFLKRISERINQLL